MLVKNSSFHFLATVFCGLFALQASAAKADKLAERGKYLITITGCNDCHTPAYGMKDGKVPESEWLVGDKMGWSGPWGTTYPTNLRKNVQMMSEKQWVAYAKNLKARPPMPWFGLNVMETEDLKAMYHFIKKLGPNANEIPAALPPGQTPKTPWLNMNPVFPEASAGK